MEEGCIQENNDLACNSLEELNTFSRNAVVRLRKCKLVMQGLFAAEFKIILKQKRGGGRLSCLIFPSIASGPP